MCAYGVCVISKILICIYTYIFYLYSPLCMYVCMHVCMQVCMYVSIYLPIYHLSIYQSIYLSIIYHLSISCRRETHTHTHVHSPFLVMSLRKRWSSDKFQLSNQAGQLCQVQQPYLTTRVQLFYQQHLSLCYCVQSWVVV